MTLMSTYKNPLYVELMLDKSLEEILFMETLHDWNVIEGDKTLRLNYPIDKTSIVFDLGGYVGDWAASIYCKYGCKLFVFEPIEYFFGITFRRFQYNDSINVYQFGLSNRDESTLIGTNGDATSVFFKNNDTSKNEKIDLRDIVNFLEGNKFEHIDLLKLNIEGSEYDVLERLIESGWISKIKHVQIQFHDFVDNAHERRDNIRKHLSHTHVETYNYKFIWESWSIK